MRITSPRLFVATLALSIVSISCGGGDDAIGGNSSTRLSDEAFCAKIMVLNEQTSSDSPNPSPNPKEMLEMLTVIQDMTKVAPTAELQEALEAYTPLLEEMSKLDQDDPEAFATAISTLFTPEVMKAAEVLDAYTTDVCGIEDGSASSSPPTS
ncbi:hypothetical protein LBMAG12_11630 [Actinomycetes bacterium]|nr:hypothetical protein LBMAG12_11630 [Actinomycetes bacterium]